MRKEVKAALLAGFVIVIVCALGLLKKTFYTPEGLAIPQRMATPPEGWEYKSTSICLHKDNLSIFFDERTKVTRICSCTYGYDEVKVRLDTIVAGTKHPIPLGSGDYFWVYVGFDPETGEEGLWIPKSHEEYICVPDPSEPSKPPPPLPTKPTEGA